MPSIYRFCRYCGRELPQGREINFCPHCGKRLSVPPTEMVKPSIATPAPPEIKPKQEIPVPTHVPTPVPTPTLEKANPVTETVAESIVEATCVPLEPPIIEKPQRALPMKPKADEPKPVKEPKAVKPAKPAPEPKPRKKRAAKAEMSKPQKRGKGGISVLIAVLILAAVFVAAYFLTPLGTTLKDLKTLYEIDTYLAASDVNSALDGVSRLNAPDKYTERIYPVYYAAALENKAKGEYDKALEFFVLCLDYSDAKEQIADYYYRLGKRSMSEHEYKKALEYFAHCVDYSDTEKQIGACNYILGKNAFKNESYAEAVEYFTNAGNYNISPYLLEQSEELLGYEDNYGEKVDFDVRVNWGGYIEQATDMIRADFTDGIRAVKEDNEIIITAEWSDCVMSSYAYKVFSELDGKETVYLEGYEPERKTLVAKIPISDIIENEAQISIGSCYAPLLSQYPRLQVILDKEQLINIAKG